MEGFAEWRAKFRTREPERGEMETGLRIALARKEQMLEWMAKDPARALKDAISRSDYEELPEALKPHFERSFNEVASLRVMPVCIPGLAREPVWTLVSGSQTFRANVVGRRKGQSSKEDTPLAGIVLGDHAVLREHAFEKLGSDDLKVLGRRPSGQADPGRDYSSGLRLGSGQVTALAGGKLYHFASEASLDAFNARLSALDDRPGPHAGSRVVLASPGDSGSGDGGFPWNEVEDEVDRLASAWTETPKKVFLIRVDFPNLTGQSASEAQLEGILNGAVTTSIAQMSYGKTRIIGEASTMIVRLPETYDYYSAGEKNEELHQDASDAYEAIAGIGSLGAYDIVGVHFNSIAMTSGGALYAGLATLGGTKMWIQATISFSTFVHELGHNYGIHHASFWKTTNGTVLGPPATQEEYGDPFDVMGSGTDVSIHHFSASGKGRLNWLTSSQIASVSSAGSSGIRRIHRFDDAGTTGATQAVRVSIPGSPDNYWIGYRAGVPLNQSLGNGAFFTLEKTGVPQTLLLDLTPGSASGKMDCALPLGKTYSDPNGVHITPVAKGGSGGDAWLDVNVQVGSFAGNQPPVLSLNAPATAVPRQTIPLSVTANDPDGDPLIYQWDFGDGTAAVIHGTASVDHMWALGGTYTVKVTANDMKGSSATTQATVTMADPLASWTGASTPIVYEAVHYLGGRFVGMSSAGFHFSADGVNWEHIVRSGNNMSYQAGPMAYDGDVFVASSGATFFRSRDGRTWEAAVSTPPAAAMRAVKSTPGKFVGVGDGFSLISSDQGKTWQSYPIGTGLELRGLAFGRGMFVTVGRAGDLSTGSPAVYTSPDGINWTACSVPVVQSSTGKFLGVEFVDGVFYAFGEQTGILRSTDGVSWTVALDRSASIWSDGSLLAIRSLTAGPGFLLAAASNGLRHIWLSSLDGHTWVRGPAPTYAPNSLYADGRLVSGKTHGSSASPKFYSTGTLQPSNRAPTASVDAPAVCAAREPVLFRSQCTDPDGDPLTLLWDFGDETLLEETSNCYHRFLAGGTHQVKLHALDRRGGVTTVTKSVTVTDPLANWTQLASNTTDRLESIAAGGGRLVAVGHSGGAYRTSPDGVSWTGGRISPETYPYPFLDEIVYHDGQFVACGYDGTSGSSQGVIYTSPDGTTWTLRYLESGSLTALVSAGGRCYAGGGDSTILSSVDGVSWSPLLGGQPGGFSSFAYGNGHFVAGGTRLDSRLVMTSPDGNTWTDTSSGLGSYQTTSLGMLFHTGDRFIGASGDSVAARRGDILYSLNHGATFKKTGTKLDSLRAFGGGNGLILGSGIMSLTNAQVNIVSIDGMEWRPLPTPAQSDRTDIAYFNSRFYTAGLAGSIWRSGEVPPLAAAGYAGWQTACFPGGDVRSGPDDDFDGDGIPNLAEYVTGSDPRDREDRGEIIAEVAGEVFTMIVPKTGGADDAVCHVEYSEHLDGWSQEGVEIVEDSSERLVVKVPTSARAGFLRAVFALR
ncbi:PKD domain-containing protein [Luteolibacter arcticus]|uniref:PKD domain-containing protein n=1 Tax=Luteolibacter arcticus TaxID=1581411 RepID=UPI002221CB4C|nr:PKD domain-containing protein [Luteolibacter arcticus]